jgi:hypothetical protein
MYIVPGSEVRDDDEDWAAAAAAAAELWYDENCCEVGFFACGTLDNEYAVDVDEA